MDAKINQYLKNHLKVATFKQTHCGSEAGGIGKSLSDQTIQEYKAIGDIVMDLAFDTEPSKFSILDCLNLPTQDLPLSDLAIQLAVLKSIFREGGIYDRINYSKAVYVMCCLACSDFKKSLYRILPEIKVSEITNLLAVIEAPERSANLNSIEMIAARYAYRAPKEDTGILDHMAEICRQLESR